jgi:TPR repeat protein
VAQYNLGRVYENDDEIKDIQIAIGWYKKAADNNDEKPKAVLERLNKEGHYLDDQHGGNTSCYSFSSRYNCIKQTLITRRITDQNRKSIRQHSNPKGQLY